jgi:putative NADPH-quinone reductase
MLHSYAAAPASKHLGLQTKWPLRTALSVLLRLGELLLSFRRRADVTAAKRILIINGHPDPRPERFCAAICQAYATGAQSHNREIREIQTGYQGVDPHASQSAGDAHGTVAAVEGALALMRWAEHIVFVYPLWLDRPPTLVNEILKAAHGECARRGSTSPGATGSLTVRVIVTMELPAFAHRSICSVNRRSTTAQNAIAEVFGAKETIFIGSVGAISAEQRARWILVLEKLGAAGL